MTRWMLASQAILRIVDPGIGTPPSVRPGFEAELRRRLREAYPAGPHGVVLPFRRVFVVAQRPGADD